MTEYQKAINLFKQMKNQNNPTKINKTKMTQLLHKGDVNAFCDLAIESLENAGHFEIIFGNKKNG